MDLHAHLMHTEVAGVLGGYVKTHEMADLEAEKGLETLRVCRAVPCRSSGSNIGCDICPGKFFLYLLKKSCNICLHFLHLLCYHFVVESFQ